MKKVIIIGAPGSGKSSFSKELFTMTKLPLFHLDLLYWNEDRTPKPKQVFLASLKEVLESDRWIIDGHYPTTLKERIQAADTIFFLDYDVETRLEGYRLSLNSKTEDRPWVASEVDQDFVKYLESFDEEERPKVIKLLDNATDKAIHIFKNRQETSDFLKAFNIQVKYDQLESLFIQHQNPQRANTQSRYLKDKFKFYGIDTKKRRELTKHSLSLARANNIIDWDFLRLCWQSEFREFHYYVIDYLKALQKRLRPSHIKDLQYFISTNQWWDSVDGLVVHFGRLAQDDESIQERMLQYSLDEDIWYRRVAILHQLKYKRETNQVLLEAILINNLNSNEFFINKAIGWSLREYSKTNPSWVRNFILDYREKLAPLSIREASKYL